MDAENVIFPLVGSNAFQLLMSFMQFCFSDVNKARAWYITVVFVFYALLQALVTFQMIVMVDPSWHRYRRFGLLFQSLTILLANLMVLVCMFAYGFEMTTVFAALLFALQVFFWRYLLYSLFTQFVLTARTAQTAVTAAADGNNQPRDVEEGGQRSVEEMNRLRQENRQLKVQMEGMNFENTVMRSSGNRGMDFENTVMRSSGNRRTGLHHRGASG